MDYRGQESPSLDGIYFNSGNCTGLIFGLARDDAGQWRYEALHDTELLVTGASQSETSELFVTSCTCVDQPNHNPLQADPNGAVWRLVTSSPDAKLAVLENRSPVERNASLFPQILDEIPVQ